MADLLSSNPISDSINVLYDIDMADANVNPSASSSTGMEYDASDLTTKPVQTTAEKSSIYLNVGMGESHVFSQPPTPDGSVASKAPVANAMEETDGKSECEAPEPKDLSGVFAFGPGCNTELKGNIQLDIGFCIS